MNFKLGKSMKEFIGKMTVRDFVKAGILISGIIGSLFSLTDLGMDINGREKKEG
jgi:hypothetical protein